MLTSETSPVVAACTRYRVFARCRLFGGKITRKDMLVGTTIEDALAEVGIREVMGIGFRVYLNDRPVKPSRFATTFPQPDDHVTVNVVPIGGGGGGGRKQGGGRLLAALAVLALTLMTGGGALPLLGAFTFLGFAAAKFKIVPPSPPKLDEVSGTGGSGSPSYYISGSRNEARQYKVVGRNLGRNLVIPAYGAQPYSELVGNDQYMRFLFVVSIGPQSIEKLRINETPLEEFEGVESEFNPGFGTDKPHKLFPKTANVQDFSLLLKEKNGAVIRTSGSDADEINLEFEFRRGLIELRADGGSKERGVHVRVEWRKRGSSDEWKTAFDRKITAETREVYRHSITWTPKDRDQYDIRMARLTDDAPTEVRAGKSTILDEVTLTKIQTFTHESPVIMPNLCTLALRIKATDQLNGDLGTFNAIC